jgi:hypothetical protein
MTGASKTIRRLLPSLLMLGVTSVVSAGINGGGLIAQGINGGGLIAQGINGGGLIAQGINGGG